MRRRTAAVALMIAAAALVGAPAEAAVTTVTTDFAMTGASADRVFFDSLIHCDGCAPDDLFSCGGCEITAGARFRPTARVEMLANQELESSFDGSTLRQGSNATVTNDITSEPGTVSMIYSLYYEAGLFGKGGDFPADWTKTSEYSVSGTLTHTASAPCTLPLSGTTTCVANINVPIINEACFGPACAVDITLTIILQHDIIVGPSGVIAQRVGTFQSPGSLTFNGPAVNDTFAVPCTAPVGSTVSYTLGGFSTPATPVDVNGKVLLGINVDGPGPANYEDEVDLFSLGNILDGTMTLSNGGTLPRDLGAVQADGSIPTLSGVSVGSGGHEGTTVGLAAAVDDNCAAGATIDWGDGSPVVTLPGTSTHRDIALSHTYGDDGTFTITLCGVDGVGTNCVGHNRTITNAGPITALDGAASVLARAGDTLNFTARTTDPGSDDITHVWDFGDGSLPVTTVALVNPPLADADPSTSVQPRAIADPQSHLFGDACTYTLIVSSSDDDGGTAGDAVTIVITGAASSPFGAGWWHQRFTEPVGVFTPARLECYLGMVGTWSTVLNEVADASTIAAATNVLTLESPAQTTQQFDRQLLAAWLNVANGGLRFEQLVDTNKDKVADTSVQAILAAAEAARLDPAASGKTLQTQKNQLEKLNLGQL